MNNWNQGYVTDVGYTYGYYTELNPLRVHLALLNAGISPPQGGFQDACELGFGQGMSANIHAAASTTNWYGTDFNSTQAAFAQKISGTAAINAKLYDDAFAEFANRTGLPDFDFIGLHGIWSWISDLNRSAIVDFVRRKLKLGGILYISYNCMPGWAAMLPMRQLLNQYVSDMSAPATPITDRIDSALSFAERLVAIQPAFTKQNPQVAERLKRMKDQNRNYLAHEYFNKDWHPMPFSRIREWLTESKLQYATSAHFADQVDAINLNQEQIKFLNEIHDPAFKEQVRDFITNAQFRRDYWVKGMRKIETIERIDALRALRFVSLQPVEDFKFTVGGNLGEANLNEPAYKPVLDLMADGKIRTLGQIEQEAKIPNIAQAAQMMTILAAKGTLGIAQDESTISKSKKSAIRLNQQITRISRTSNDLGAWASPVTGGGIAISRFHQLFLDAYARGTKSTSEYADEVWQLLLRQGQRLLKDGKPISDDEGNKAELNRQANEFQKKHLPVYKQLGLI